VYYTYNNNNNSQFSVGDGGGAEESKKRHTHAQLITATDAAACVCTARDGHVFVELHIYYTEAHNNGCQHLSPSAAAAARQMFDAKKISNKNVYLYTCV